MDSLAKSDIFFVITTFAVVLVTLVAIVASVYIVKILKDIKYVSKRVKEETDNISEDLKDVREHLKKKSFKWLSLAGLAKKIFDNRRRAKK